MKGVVLMGWVFKIDQNNKAESPDIKVMGFFCFKIPSDSPLKKRGEFFSSPFLKGD
jgi:hypothetical protein